MLALVIDTSSAAVTAAVVWFEDDAAGGDGAADVGGDGPAEDGTGRTGAGRGLKVLAERVTIDARAHAELLAPSLAACLDEAGTTPAGIGAVIAGIGPGPFTGLRVGLVTAAAMADALQLPTYGVCSLDAIAAGTAHPEALLVAGDARRREVYWATYAGHDGAPAESAGRRAGPEVTRAVDVPRAGVTAMAGAGARLYQAQLGLPLLDADYPTARGLARLAAARVRSGAPSETLIPLYLRRPDAVAATSFKAVTR